MGREMDSHCLAGHRGNVQPSPLHTQVDNSPTRRLREVLMGFQWQSNLAISQSALQALCFAEGGLLGLAQQRCITAWTHHVWVDPQQTCLNTAYLHTASQVTSSPQKRKRKLKMCERVPNQMLQPEITRESRIQT
ncbi:unnamed protein product [Pleuronectes platessa]|uniref:Uncharacterized protein n=1 Tax=Pleuronectes platessa TaxID=8262 RepID=A0A9N7YBL4_PLEPL|nr:unnamed protein product [Pleuronectes platessa]